jgi:uncharacterized protein
MLRDTPIFQSQEFINLCKIHKVKELYAFGSLAKGTATTDSDVDLIVELDEADPVFKGKLLLSLYNKLESYFKKKVDLVTVDSVKNPILEEYIGTSKQIVYARELQES